MNDNNPMISIIVPMYNVERYIGFCLDSIFRQTYEDYEVILIDDASTDDTVEICKRICRGKPAVTLVKNETNRRQHFCRNKGLDMAKGKYIYFLDSDDEIVPEALEVLYNNAEKEQADVVHTNFFITSYAEGRMLSRGSLWELNAGGYTSVGLLNDKASERLRCMLASGMPMPWMNLIRKDFLIGNRIYFKSLMISEDDVFTTELFLKAGKLVCINDPLNIYRKYYNEKERVIKRLPCAIPLMAEVMMAYDKLFDEFTLEELPLSLRIQTITGWLRAHLKAWIHDVIDTRREEDFLRLKKTVESSVGKDSIAVYLLPHIINIMDTDSALRSYMETLQDKAIKKYEIALNEIKSGAHKGDYAYQYSIAKRCLFTGEKDEEFCFQIYCLLAESSFQLGLYEESWKNYERALRYASLNDEQDNNLRFEMKRILPYREAGIRGHWPAEDRRKFATKFSDTCGAIFLEHDNGCPEEKVILGVFAHYYSITDEIISCWREIMEQVTCADILIAAMEFETESMMVEAAERLLAFGFDSRRVHLKGYSNELFSEADILLDTYPESQGNIIMQGLLQGIPAVANYNMCKEPNAGAAILNDIGLEELVARNTEEYIDKVVALAKDTELLHLLKKQLPVIIKKH